MRTDSQLSTSTVPCICGWDTAGKADPIYLWHLQRPMHGPTVIWHRMFEVLPAGRPLQGLYWRGRSWSITSVLTWRWMGMNDWVALRAEATWHVSFVQYNMQYNTINLPIKGNQNRQRGWVDVSPAEVSKGCKLEQRGWVWAGPEAWNRAWISGARPKSAGPWLHEYNFSAPHNHTSGLLTCVHVAISLAEST